MERPDAPILALAKSLAALAPEARIVPAAAWVGLWQHRPEPLPESLAIYERLKPSIAHVIARAQTGVRATDRQVCRITQGSQRGGVTHVPVETEMGTVTMQRVQRRSRRNPPGERFTAIVVELMDEAGEHLLVMLPADAKR